MIEEYPLTKKFKKGGKDIALLGSPNEAGSNSSGLDSNHQLSTTLSGLSSNTSKNEDLSYVSTTQYEQSQYFEAGSNAQDNLTKRKRGQKE